MGDQAWTREVPRLSGPLVTVREVVASDARTLFELLSDPAVAEHVSTPPPSAEAFCSFIAWAQRQRATGQSVCFGIVPHGLGAAVGIIQVRALEPSFFTAEWGFALGKAFWGTGVFIEAADLVAEFAFTSMNVYRLEARAVDANARGLGALQKLGARAEGTLDRAFRKNGHQLAQLLWSLHQDEWRQRPLIQQRVSAVDARNQVARAIFQTAQMIAAGRPKPPQSPSTGGYPFFLTESK